jgi:hypothetical protein
MFTLNLSDITSNYRSVAITAMFLMRSVSISVSYPFTKFHKPSSNSSLVVAMKLNPQFNFGTIAILSPYTMRNITLRKAVYFSTVHYYTSQLNPV